MKSQNASILKHLTEGKTINPAQAMSMFGCMRLAARINDLRNAGFAVISETIRKNSKHYSQYRLAR
jgi:sulfur transfer protein SufE